VEEEELDGVGDDATLKGLIPVVVVVVMVR
jgi:hypothetical protein